MNADSDAPLTSRPRPFDVLKFSLYGLLCDLLLVTLWVLYVMAATAGVGCDGEPCTAAGFILSRVVFAFQIGLGVMFYWWVILLPLLAAPPAIGFAVDCARASGRAGDG